MHITLARAVALSATLCLTGDVLTAAESSNRAQDKAIETAIELFKVPPDRIRQGLMSAKSTLHPAGFEPRLRDEMPLSESERRRGVAAKVRYSFAKINSPRTGYYFYLIYRDQAAALKGRDDDPDAVPIVEKITLQGPNRSPIEVSCQPWSPPSAIGARCWRVEPSLPVVVVGAIEERQNTKTQKLEKSFVDPARLLNTAIDLLHREVK